MRSITAKLTLGLFVICVVEAAMVAISTREVTQREFNRFIQDRVLTDIADDVVDFYEREDSWDGVVQYFEPSEERKHWRRRRASRWQRYVGQFALLDSTGLVLIPSGSFRAGEKVSANQLDAATPLFDDDRFIGTLVHTEKNPPLNSAEKRYLERTYEALLYAFVVALAFALAVGFFMARRLTYPLRQLTMATKAIAEGQTQPQLAIRSKDELGTLTAAFNQMNVALDKAHALRKQMTEDVAHELRTPLTSLIGYLEGMRRGDLEPKKERIQIMYAEAKNLERLVNDLRTLSLADANQLPLSFQRVSIETMLSQVEVAFEIQMRQKDISFLLQAPDSLPECWLDPFRIEQVLDNLIVNAMRHTPAGGQIVLSAKIEGGEVYLAISDTGAGIAAEQLPFIFERFYRVETARPSSGEASTGIGLAIVKSYVEAHGGRVLVESVLGQGTTFTVVLPLDCPAGQKNTYS